VAGDETEIDGRYRIVSRLGAGAVGEVFRVRHEGLGRDFALKALAAEWAEDRTALARFDREARAAARLDHPGVARVLDRGRLPDGRPFLVMDWVDGPTLGALAQSRSLAPRRVVELVHAALLALEHAHARGVLHRDVKPENVLVEDPDGAARVRVVDFGLAKLHTIEPSGDTVPDDRVTRTGMVFGTPRYMAPEQATGEGGDHRVDVYAVGVLLYELLAGRPPYAAPSIAETLRLHIVADVPELPLAQAEGVDLPRLKAAVARAMAKRPEDRFPSARALADALEAALSPTRPAKSEAEPATAALGPSVRAPRRWIALAGGLFVAGLGLGALAFPERPLGGLESGVAEALAAGDAEAARARAGAAADADADDAEAHLGIGHAAFALGDDAAALAAYRRALALDPARVEDPLLALNLRRALAEKEKEGEALLEAIAGGDTGAGAALLRSLATAAPSARARRTAYEGLERRGRAARLDRFEWLSGQLEAHAGDRCAHRKWYVERLIALDDARVRPILERERHRKGGFLDLSRTGDCMRAEIDAALGAR
jgi:tetratricopeptide (TPR) repeat protein